MQNEPHAATAGRVGDLTSSRSEVTCHAPNDAAGAFPAKIVTEVTKATTFYPAEEYHQDYFANNPRQPYCQAVVAPKVDKVRKVFKDLLAN